MAALDAHQTEVARAILVEVFNLSSVKRTQIKEGRVCATSQGAWLLNVAYAETHGWRGFWTSHFAQRMTHPTWPGAVLELTITRSDRTTQVAILHSSQLLS